MAKRRSRYSSAPIVRTVSAPAPVIRLQAPRQIVVPRRSRGGGRRRSRGGGSHALTPNTMFAGAVGGALLGFLDKTLGSSLPTIPILGRAGTIAVGAYLFRNALGKGIMRDVAIAASAVAGYQFGTQGRVSGDDLDGSVAPQVSGIAAQV